MKRLSTMANYMLPINAATQAQLIKRKSAIKQCGPVSEVDTLTDEHASLPAISDQRQKQSRQKARRGLSKKKKTKPEFYRYSEKQELEQDDNLVYDDLEHTSIKMDHEEHKGRKLDISC
jgi:hypothetical protein